MANVSYGAWPIAEVPFKTIREIAVAVLEDEGYRVHRRRITERQAKIEGIRGSKWFAHLGQQIPFGALLGIGARVKATVLCRRSLTEGDSDLRLSVRCAPVQEWDSVEEEYLTSQGRVERIGDNAKARQCFFKLVNEFRRRAVI